VTLFGQRAIAEIRSDAKARSIAFIEIFVLRCLSVCVFLTTYGILIVSNASNPKLYWLLAIEILSVAFDISWFFQGMELFRIITLFNGISKVVGTIFIFGFVKSADDLNLYVLFYSGSLLIGHMAAWSALPKYISVSPIRLGNLFGRLKSSLRLFVSQFAIQIYTVLDKTMIGVITKSDFENGYYEQSQKLIKVLVTIVTSINTVVASRVTILWNCNKKDEVNELIENSFRIILALSFPMALGTYIVAPSIVPIYYGAGYEGVVPLIRTLAMLLPIIGCSNIIGMQLFVPIKKEKWLTYSVVVGAMVNLVLNTFMISWFSSVGAAIASVIAELVVTLTQFYLARNLVDIKKVIRMAMRYMTFTGVMAIPALLLLKVLTTGFMTIVVEVFVCCGIYFVLLVMFKDPILSIFITKRSR